MGVSGKNLYARIGVILLGIVISTNNFWGYTLGVLAFEFEEKNL